MSNSEAIVENEKKQLELGVGIADVGGSLEGQVRWSLAERIREWSESESYLGGRSERKKVKSYKEVNADVKDRADQIIAEALGDDSDHDPDYNPKGEKEDDDDIYTSLNRRKIKSFTPTSSSSTKSYSRITLPRETFPCQQCSKKFETKSKLNEHVDDDHERSCAECEDDFSWPDPSHECYFTKYKLRMVAGDIMPAY